MTLKTWHCQRLLLWPRAAFQLINRWNFVTIHHLSQGPTLNNPHNLNPDYLVTSFPVETPISC